MGGRTECRLSDLSVSKQIFRAFQRVFKRWMIRKSLFPIEEGCAIDSVSGSFAFKHGKKSGLARNIWP